MKVLIDLTQIPLNRTGVGVYADHLIAGLLPILPPKDELILLTQSDDPFIPRLSDGAPNVRVVRVPSRIFRNRAMLMLFEQTVIPLLAWLKRCDLIHSLHYTHPLFCLTPRLVTIHDLTFILFPQLHTRGRRLIMPFFIRHAIRRAEALVFVSKATQDDAQRLFRGGGYRGQVIPLGVTFPLRQGPDSAPQQVQDTPRLSNPFFLFVGTIEPRKNVVRIVQAFERLSVTHPQLDLVLAGKLGWHTAEIMSVIQASPARSHIRHLGFVTEVEKQALLEQCVALVYPSLYEGFGLPVLEAMAAGAPVITSNVSSLPEVAGDAAIIVEPTSIDAIKDAMAQIFIDPALRSHLRQAGRRQAASFTWERMCSSTLSFYLQITQRR